MRLPAILTRWIDRRACVASMKAARRFICGPDGTTYMTRFYLTKGPYMLDGTYPFDEQGEPRDGVIWPRFPLGVYMHCIHTSDPDGELHSHPWRWALSLVLSGSYREEVLGSDGKVFVRERSPGSLALLKDSTFHRVALPEGRRLHVWTLFVVGPRSKSWGFLDPTTGAFTHWKDRLRPAEAAARPYGVTARRPKMATNGGDDYRRGR